MWILKINGPRHNKNILLYGMFTLLCMPLAARNNQQWDDTQFKNWPSQCREIAIISTLDSEIQPAYFFKAADKNPRPLVVSLHTWSGGYAQRDTLSWMCIERDYHYIHPHFRGPNRTFKACGSPGVIQDIEDAIAYATQNANVDTASIHVVGTSGGGYASLLAYMNTQHPVKTFSAWVPISDLKKWYSESKGRGTRYAYDIARCTVDSAGFTQKNHFLGEVEAIRRSPFYMKTPVKQRKNATLYICAGVHDGYRGSVPVTQSLHFYNKVVGDFDPGEKAALISDDAVIELLASRGYRSNGKRKIGNRLIHYQKSYEDKVHIVVFEGGHEMLPGVALNPVEKGELLK